MDVLSEIISSMRINGSALSAVECAGEWGIDMETGAAHGDSDLSHGIPFHYIVAGHCWLRGEGGPIELSEGDLVVAPHWPSHALASSTDGSLEKICNLIEANGLHFWTGGTLERPLTFRVGDGVPDVRILTGLFSLKGRGAAMLIDHLPGLMHLGIQDDNLAPQLKTALEFIKYEGQASRPGYVAVASRLMDLLFIQILRSAIMQPSVRIGLLAGLADDYVGRALTAIHASPSTCWTVGKLAVEACLSRTSFAERFRQLVGVTPMHYVAQWRMAIAEDMLKRSEVGIEQIRANLGFSSSFVFSRAFRSHYGMSPREFRRASQSAVN